MNKTIFAIKISDFFFLNRPFHNALSSKRGYLQIYLLINTGTLHWILGTFQSPGILEDTVEGHSLVQKEELAGPYGILSRSDI